MVATFARSSRKRTIAPDRSPRIAQRVEAWIAALDAKDSYTAGHSDRVARMAVCLGRRLGLSSEELQTLYLSGLLHDVGKLGLAEGLLRKASPLTPAERAAIETHPDLGHAMLLPYEELAATLPAVRRHHEAWNGGGYPGGWSGERIPLFARIVAVADSLDAMTSNRSYRAALSAEEADRILREGAGRQWDPAVIAAYEAERENLRTITAGSEPKPPRTIAAAAPREARRARPGAPA